MLSRLSLCAALICGPAFANGFAPGDSVDSPLALVAPVLENYEYFGEGNPNTVITVAPNEDNVLEVRIEDTGFLDDSAEGQRTIYAIEYAPEGGWLILDVSVEQRCYRGDDRDWQTEPCL